MSSLVFHLDSPVWSIKWHWWSKKVLCSNKLLTGRCPHLSVVTWTACLHALGDIAICFHVLCINRKTSRMSSIRFWKFSVFILLLPLTHLWINFKHILYSPLKWLCPQLLTGLQDTLHDFYGNPLSQIPKDRTPGDVCVCAVRCLELTYVFDFPVP